MILTNPLGLFALLGIPAVLLIHFLQRQARVLPVSTLFLLDQTHRESVSGRRFDRLTNSVPLWLQLLMVLLLTWLLVEPRYPKATSVQQIAVIVDSSASMSVFQEKLVEKLEESLSRLKGPAHDVQLYLLPSDPNAPALYVGDDFQDGLAALSAYQFSSGALDPSPALRLGRSRIRSEGLLIYATDSDLASDLPFDAQLLAVGEPTPNLGFTGVTIGDDNKSWQATLRNYSDQSSASSWTVEFPDGSTSAPRTVELNPNGLKVLTGTIPEGVAELTIRLAGDAFPMDDTLPLVVPQPKKLITQSALAPKFADFQKRFYSFFPNLETNASGEPDLTLAAYDPLFPVLPATNAILTIDESVRSRKFLAGGIVPETHPLMTGLNWQALQLRETVTFPILASDQILLWQGQRPLIFIRETAPRAATETEEAQAAVSTLVFNFDLSLSNALKLPSTVILLHRFTSTLRDRKVAYEALNSESSQILELAHDRKLPLTLVSLDEQGATVKSSYPPTATLRAPAQPGHFEVRQGGRLLLRSASFFADTREADLRKAASADTLNTQIATAVDRHTDEDHFWPFWTLLVLTAALLTWYFSQKPTKSEDQSVLKSA